MQQCQNNLHVSFRRCQLNKTEYQQPTQTECLFTNAEVQVSGCSECLRLLLPRQDGRDTTCMRCEKVEDLLSLAAELKDEVERLRSIRECAQETRLIEQLPAISTRKALW